MDREAAMPPARLAAFPSKPRREDRLLSQSSHSLACGRTDKKEVVNSVSLFKRGNTWWSYAWVDGIRHAKSTKTSNRRIAERIDQQFKDELSLARLGMRVPRPEMTFGELAMRFLADGTPRPYHRDRL